MSGASARWHLMAVALVLGGALVRAPPARELVVEGLGNRWLAVHSGEVISSSLGVLLHHNSFATLVSSPALPDSDPSIISQLRPDGGSITFTVDLHSVGCACNLAVYLVSAPARLISGHPNAGSRGDYYCDANAVGGQLCPEIDLMEANTHTFAATPHKCDAPVGDHHYTSCDHSGRGQSTNALPGAYGPGSKYKIDTTQEFQVSTRFEKDGEDIVALVTTLSQQGRQVELKNVDRPYLKALTKPLQEGMSLVMSYWGADHGMMDWLDGSMCGQQSCAASAGAAFISGLHIEEETNAVVPRGSGEVTPRVPPPTTATPSPTSPTSTYSCQYDGTRWTMSRRQACCRREGVGCDHTAVVTTTTWHMGTLQPWTPPQRRWPEQAPPHAASPSPAFPPSTRNEFGTPARSGTWGRSGYRSYPTDAPTPSEASSWGRPAEAQTPSEASLGFDFFSGGVRFNCDDGKESLWTMEKKEHCCTVSGRSCDELPAGGHAGGRQYSFIRRFSRAGGASAAAAVVGRGGAVLVPAAAALLLVALAVLGASSRCRRHGAATLGVAGVPEEDGAEVALL